MGTKQSCASGYHALRGKQTSVAFLPKNTLPESHPEKKSHPEKNIKMRKYRARYSIK